MAYQQTPGKRYAVSNPADNPQATARKSLPLPCLTLVTEPNPNLLSIVKEAVAGGVDLVQLREKPPFSREAFNVAWDISEVTLGRALLIINGYVGLVRKVGADGFHLPEVSLFLSQEQDYSQGRDWLDVPCIWSNKRNRPLKRG